MMPEMDGIETLHEMKKLTDFPSKDAPVIILTANAIAGAKEMYLKEGFDAYLAKPIDHKKLEALIAALLDDSLKQAVLKPVDAGSEESSVKDDEQEEFPMIEGLDWRFAKQHFNDTESLMDTVQFFANTLELEATTLSKLFADVATIEGQKAYCTKVHSMKNSAATIGVISLAGMAKVLEDAARNGEVETLERVTPVFLTTWRSYKEKMAAFTKGDVSDAFKKNAAECLAEINDLIAQIRVAAESMDIDGLDALWKQLEEYKFEESQQELVDAIQKAILEFDIDFLQGLNAFE
jgi:CheY-like chemotaxis protein